MPRIIQIRHVPDRVHLRLKDEARRQGLTLASFVLGELQKTVGIKLAAGGRRAARRASKSTSSQSGRS